jgi:uncharacterized protein (TIRG00374 family)
MRGVPRKFLIILLAVVVLGILLYRSRDAIRLEDFDWSQLKDSILHVNGWLILLSVFGIYGAYAIRAQRWARFSQHLGPQSFRRVFRATLIGFSALFLLGRAGEPIRPLLIARKERQPVSSAFGIYVLERIFDVASTVAILGVSLLTFPNLIAEGNTRGGALLVAMRATGIGMLVGLPVMIGFLVYFRLHGAGKVKAFADKWRREGRLSGWRARAAGLLLGFGEGLQAIRSLHDLAVALGYSAAHWVLIVVIYWVVCMSFGGRLAAIGLSGATLTLAFSMVGSTLQLPGVGGGSQAACFIALNAVLGVEKEPAAAAAILIWLVTFAACTAAGVPLLIHEGWSVGELRRMAKAEKEAEAHGAHIETPGNEVEK